MNKIKAGMLILVIGVIGGIELDRWYGEAIQPTAYAAPEEEPREIRIEISYLKWDAARIEQEIRANLPEVFVKIAECESHMNQYDRFGDVLQGRVDKDDTGVLQINKRYHLAAAEELGLDLDTPVGNIAYAKVLYNKMGLSPWNASKKCWSV